MITIRIDNPVLCAGLVSEIIRMIETTDGMDKLLADGVDPHAIDALRNMSVRDLREISSRMRSWSFSFSLNDMHAETIRLSHIREDQALCEYFVRHGASRGMVAELWKISKADVTSMRTYLLPSGNMVGRPVRPGSHELRQRIHEAWSAIAKANPQISRRRHIYELHQRFNEHTINSLYSVVTEFDYDDAPQFETTIPGGLDDLPLTTSKLVDGVGKPSSGPRHVN